MVNRKHKTRWFKKPKYINTIPPSHIYLFILSIKLRGEFNIHIST